jgi:hypothetical protein
MVRFNVDVPTARCKPACSAGTRDPCRKPELILIRPHCIASNVDHPASNEGDVLMFLAAK